MHGCKCWVFFMLWVWTLRLPFLIEKEIIIPLSLCSVQIQAVNAIGSSPLSPPLLARTRPLPPAPPPLECSAAGPQSLKLKWGENASNTHTRALLADDMVYTLQMEDKNHRWSAKTNTHTHTALTSSLTSLYKHYIDYKGGQFKVLQTMFTG